MKCNSRNTGLVRIFSWIWVSLVLTAATGLRAGEATRTFTPLLPMPAPTITGSSIAYPGGRYDVTNLTDGNQVTEYSSDGKGTDTFVEFELATPTRIGAFRHVDRNDPATVASSELVFYDSGGAVAGTVPVVHANTRGGVTFFTLPTPVSCRRIRWHVTGLGPSGYGTVGGAEIAFFAAGEPDAVPRRITIETKAIPILRKEPPGLVQPLRLTIHHPYAEPADAFVRVGDLEPKPVLLKPGAQSLEVFVPAVDADETLDVSVEAAGQTMVGSEVGLKPVRKMVIYILPHSHTDIGYTEIQTAIEKKQVENLRKGIAYARRTADYPPGAQFKWNVEVVWAADLYLRRMSAAERAEFFEAVKKGWVALNGMYLNELTGLCRPEELLRLFRCGTRLAEECGVTVDAAMISDVPGYTWATVTAMAHAGIRYFSTAPNYFDRIGDILVVWENKPFYWVSPSGREKVLVWIPYKGYAMSHVHRELTPRFVEDYLDQLERTGYPYDIAHMRWSGHGDNAEPDPGICEFVKEWNPAHASPVFIISSTSEAFRAFEARHGDRLPEFRGDWTPYWEDGAGSSALETAMNRASSDRLTQAEALFAMRDPAAYPAPAFEEAWRNVLLYSEHTWGAWCSVSDPEHAMTKEQWEIKRSYALQADARSRELLSRALRANAASRRLPSRALPRAASPQAGSAVDIYNTTSWPRTDLVTLPQELSAAGDRVTGADGRAVPSQRLSSGELAFLARDVPPFAARRYRIQAGPAHTEGTATARGAVLENDLLRLRLGEKTGALAELNAKGMEHNFVDPGSGHGLNEYLFLPGDDLADLKRNGPAGITVKEAGPLVASLLVESAAPGCHKLTREVRLIAGLDRVELINTVDKKRAQANPKPGDWAFAQKGGKESVNFAFPFQVKGGQMRLELPFAVIRPELDQLPSACKNWFTVGRWADVSNNAFGVTWVTLDAPLVQVGGITATMLGSQANPDVWRKRVEKTQRLYAWVMNNHWGTNYRAYQEGPVAFRFVLHPHRRYDPVEAARLATGLGQPLVAAPAAGPEPPAEPCLRVEPDDVLVTCLKPSDDGKGTIVRLFGASGSDRQARLVWSDPTPRRTWLSDLGEKPRERADGAVTVPGWGVVTLRVEQR